MRTLVTLSPHTDPVADRARLAARALALGLQIETIIEQDGRRVAVLVDGVPSVRPRAIVRRSAQPLRPVDADVVDASAQREGLRLVRWEPSAGRATLAALDPWTAQLRDRLSEALRCRPWDVDVATTWRLTGDGAAALASVVVPRSPLIVEGPKRRAVWRDILETVVAPGSQDWVVVDDPESATITLRWREDPLRDTILLEDFITRYRQSSSTTSFPIAIREDGATFDWAVFHTLCAGQTGAGKGSYLWSVISGVLPAIAIREASVWFIDPKSAEATAAPGVCSRIATTPGAWSLLLDELVETMRDRQARLGRKAAITEDDPLILLVVDELSNLGVFDSDAKRRAAVQGNLNLVLSQGRSANIFVIGAVQSVTKEAIGARNFYAARIGLRLENAAETSLLLGEGAVDEGAACHRIPPANPGNAYATAGIGYARADGEVAPVRLRFPYASDELLERWSDELDPITRAEREGFAARAASTTGAPFQARPVSLDEPLDLSDVDLDGW